MSRSAAATIPGPAAKVNIRQPAALASRKPISVGLRPQASTP